MYSQPLCHLSGFPRAAGRGRGRNDTGRRVGGQGEGGTLQAVFPVVKGPCPKSPFPFRSASCSTRSPSCRSSPSASPTRPSWTTRSDERRVGKERVRTGQTEVAQEQL